MLAEADTLAPEFPFHEVMTVEVVGGLEGEKGADAQQRRAEHFVADVEVVVRIARPLPLRMRGRRWETSAEGNGRWGLVPCCGR